MLVGTDGRDASGGLRRWRQGLMTHEPMRRVVGPSPVAGIVCGQFPLPESTGGRKRTVRLIQAIQSEGCTPVILTHASVTEEGLHEATARGWRVESFPMP